MRADRDSVIRHGMVRLKSLLFRHSRHEVQRYLAAVEKLLGPVPALMPEIFLTEAERELALRSLHSAGGGERTHAIAICPGARWKTKTWGADRMSRLAEMLVDAGYGVLVLGGPADESVLQEMRLRCENVEAVTFHNGDLRSIAALMSQCSCAVSNDSGLMHVAYSVGTPVVAIFGSTTPEFGFYPPDSRSTVISKSFRCKPCDVHGKDECKKGDLRCMESVKISEVIDAVETTVRPAQSCAGQTSPVETTVRLAQSRAGETPPVEHSLRKQLRRVELPRFVLDEGEPQPSGAEWTVPERGSIVVRVPNWVGDVVMACPSLQALRSCTHGLRLVTVAHERVASLIENVPLMDELVVLDSRRVVGLLRTALALRRTGFTLGIAMPDSFSSALLFWLGGVKRIVGFRGELRDMFLSTRLLRKKWSHLSEQYAQLLPKVCTVGGRFILKPEPGDVNRARKILEEVGVPDSSQLALVAPGASYGETKRWPEEKYSELVRLLTEKSQFQVILVGNAAETALCARIARKGERATANLSGRTTLRDLVAIASIASVFVGNDSGAAHVAAVSGCPVVAVFGSSDPSWTAPRGENVRTVYEKLSCSPCFLSDCPYELQCLSQIDVEDVYRATIGVSRRQ